MTRSRVWPGWAPGHTRLADFQPPVAVCAITARIGLPFKPPNQPVVLVRPIASLGTAVAVVGAVIPAWIGSRKRPVEALKR